MADIAALIRSAVFSAREINRMLVAEMRAKRAIANRYEARPVYSMSPDECADWHKLCHHNDAIWQLQIGRDECMQFARGLRRMASYLSASA